MEKTRSIFETQWGKLVESLVEGKLIKLLRDRGIKVRQTGQRVEVCYEKTDGGIQRREFDIIALNGKEVVVVEVKTTLTPDKVKYFLESLKDFKKYFPDYKSKTVYGAVAYLRSESGSSSLFSKAGVCLLFVLQVTAPVLSTRKISNLKPLHKKSFKTKRPDKQSMYRIHLHEFFF